MIDPIMNVIWQLSCDFAIVCLGLAPLLAGCAAVIWAMRQGPKQ